ncbi:hypothetical protein [Pseudomonas moorei]|uniref:hypothetical protein n=1 Tax=Pseudomonas moorei TaxID=395599 RepID=UPI001FF4D24A|nr:hypothetical protein [Pseudomonas moorei]
MFIKSMALIAVGRLIWINLRAAGHRWMTSGAIWQRSGLWGDRQVERLPPTRIHWT